jgi:ribosomal protein S18 acetylase RimI-like enzyme
MNPKELHIRPFQIEDYDALVSMWERAGLPFKPRGRDNRENLEKELQKGIAEFLLAEMKGKVIGSVLGTHDGRKGWINRLAVDPEYRRNGIAKMLLNAVEKKLEEQGIGIISCLVETWNTESMAFFKKMDYIKHMDIVYYSKRLFNDV